MFEIQVFEKDSKGGVTNILLLEAEYVTQLGDEGKTVLLLEGLTHRKEMTHVTWVDLSGEIQNNKEVRDLVDRECDQLTEVICNHWDYSMFVWEALVMLGHDPQEMDQDKYEELSANIRDVVLARHSGSLAWD